MNQLHEGTGSVTVDFFRDYVCRYGGTALFDTSRSTNSEEWHSLLKQATAKLEHYKRIYTVTAPDEKAEKMAICAMIDALYFYATAQNGEMVSSASIGSVSVNYNAPKTVDLSPKAQEKELFRCASLYLEIYRGVS